MTIDSTAASPPPRRGVSSPVHLLRILPVGGARPATVVLTAEPVTIGRQGHVTGPLALIDSEISRVHAIVAPADDGWTITDQGSRNGTFVDGARAERAPLVDGTVIRVGKTLLVHVHDTLRADEQLTEPTETLLAGTSLAMLRLHAEIGQVAPHDVAVLILGETGVGKERVAEELHRRSGRAGAFVPVNCAAIAPQLAESELFGHVGGAFTGATRAADGLFVAADGGTLFLDEIGELPLELQPKLLRALASGEVRAVGSSATRQVKVRIVAATLRDLAGATAAGDFRIDLFNRLAGWRIQIPPLRARRDDVVAIANALLRRRQGPTLSVDAAEALVLHDWSGNVRELEQLLAAATIRVGNLPRATLDLEHLPAELTARLSQRAITVDDAPPPAVPLPLLAARDVTPTRDELCAALTRWAGSVARVAEHFDKDRQQIYRWARRYQIDLAAFRGADEPEPGE